MSALGYLGKGSGRPALPAALSPKPDPEIGMRSNLRPAAPPALILALALEGGDSPSPHVCSMAVSMLLLGIIFLGAFPSQGYTRVRGCNKC